jgi:L-ascorbate metabolism protein UlaG (beta-lactamase superfamily)
MRIAWSLLSVVLMGVGALAAEPVTVTFVAGSGYIVSQGEFRVAIDGLTSLTTSATTQALMSAAQPPFDVDLILVTHTDSDHFSAPVIAANMTANAQAVLVGSGSVVRAVRTLAPSLAADRFVTVHPGLSTPVTLEVAGAAVDAYSFPLPGPENIGYRFRVGGLAFAHPGDLNFDTIVMDFARTGWTATPPDVLILPYFLFNTESIELFASSCPARLYVPTHAVFPDLATACARGREVTSNVLCFTASLEMKTIELTPQP